MNAIDTIQDLQNIIIFGIGSLFLYLVVPVALFANEVRLAKQSDDTSGTASILNSIMQAFFYIVVWSVLVSIIMFLVIKLGRPGEHNPAVGIYRFWSGNPEWISINDPKSMAANAMAVVGNFANKDSEEQAKLLVLIIEWAKAVELLLLGVLLALTFKLSVSLPLMKMRRADHYKMTSRVDLGTMMSIFMTGILGWVLFVAVIHFEEILLSSLLKAGAAKSNSSIITNTQVSMLKDLKILLQSGMEAL